MKSYAYEHSKHVSIIWGTHLICGKCLQKSLRLLSCWLRGTFEELEDLGDVDIALGPHLKERTCTGTGTGFFL